MTSNDIVYVTRNSSSVERPVAALQRELPQFQIQSIPRLNDHQQTDLSSADCIVYEHNDQVTDLSQVLAEIRSDDPSIPILFVIQPDSDVSLGEILAAEQTDVIRTTNQSDDIPLLAHRIETLIEADRQRSKLVQAKDRYDTLFERLTHSAVETRFDDMTPIVKRVNQAFENTFGYDSDEIVGESLDSYIIPPDRTEEAKQINQRALTGEVFSREVVRRTATGQQDFLLTTGVYDEPERFAIYTDITQQKRQKRELEQLNERLEQQNERLTQFADVVTHDLQNPLNVAMMAAQRAERTGDKEMFERLHQSLDRMGMMRDELIALTQSEAQIDEIETIYLGSIAREAWRTVETAEAELLVAVPDDLGVKADHTLLVHVLENLFQNAVDHNPSPVTVTVGVLEGSTDRDGFYVEDDGTGIPREDRDEVFEYGYTTSGQGTGLGLSIVNEFVVLHEWEIRVSKSETGGARFEITGVEFGTE